ncbi:MAG TPA: EAL domain-containing protein [Xanthobacteraceae bacterium]|nr:EAL domain-containing protein [Xanthobacteraceae bacterium]
MRFGAFLVGLCMVIIAASLGATAYLLLDLTAVEATAIGVTVLSALTAYNAFASRARERADLAQRIADLSRGTGELARQVGEQGRRLLAVEAAMGQAAERTRAATEPLAAELEVLGTLIKQLAESVAAHERQLAQAPGAPPLPPAAAAAPEADMPLAAARETEGFNASDRQEPESPPALQHAVRAALEGNRLDLFLQPIVTLPQRKVRFYEATTRLRTEDGSPLLPADYLSPAESGGLMPMLDNLMVFRCVQVVRRLTNRNRDAGLFCNLAVSTLADSEFFPQFFEFLTGNRTLAPALVFEFAQNALRGMGPVERESLAQLAELGFRFSMDRVTDLQFEARALAEQGFRYIKVPAALLTDRAAATAADIHPTDLAHLLARYGIDLIAEKIETEGTVVDLLDYDVKFAQGYLFAHPRPVRSEVFQGAPERPRKAEPVAPDAAAGPEARGLVQLARAFARKAS